jgi:hypothetical protein
VGTFLPALSLRSLLTFLELKVLPVGNGYSLKEATKQRSYPLVKKFDSTLLQSSRNNSKGSFTLQNVIKTNM